MELAEFRWHGIRLTLRCTFAHPGRKAHVLSVLEAIVKGISEAAGLIPPDIRTVFRWPGARVREMNIESGRLVPLEILLFGADTASATRWYEQAIHYFDAGAPGRNFEVASAEAPIYRSWMDLIQTRPLPDALDEICLDFLTPLPFVPTQAHEREWLDGEGIYRAMHERLKRLFGAEVRLPASPKVVPAYWSYCEIVHAAHPGGKKYLNGCIGPLLLRGDNLADWWPWLVLFEEIGLGAQVTFGQGRFRLLDGSRPILDGALTDPGRVGASLSYVLERHADLAARLSDSPQLMEPNEIALELARTLRIGHVFQPFQAVPIPRDDGRKRQFEMPGPRDRVVLHHISHLLKEPFDRLFSVNSIGYRKGHSREDAVECVRAAIRDGCTHVLESDISDFFPSVDLERLLIRLDEVLPRRDVRLRKVLEDVIRNSWRRGDAPAQPRTRGLPLGSPLSPLLANLYLDSFDKQLNAVLPGVRLIRYADDFIILTDAENTAYELLDCVRDAAESLGLTLNLEKTAVRALSEGFDFLGIRFCDDGLGEKASDESPDAWRKILYITEPYAFIGANHGTIEVHAGGKTLGSFPLTRTAGVVTLAPCTMSSALIARLADHGIPLTIAGVSGRQIATVAGDTAQRFATAARQAHKHESIGEAGRCQAAAAFAQAKLANCISLVRQRGHAGSAALISTLESGIGAIAAASDVEVIRGIEGDCAREYFPFMAGWIRNTDFPWQGRRHHGECPDRLNSLLNFGYHLLFTRINALIRVIGLNPYLGFLHASNGRYEALACDVQEAFRSHVDRFVVRLLNLGIIQASDFEETDEGWWLVPPARNRFLQQFAREIERRPMRRTFSLGESIEGQVRAIHAWLMEDRALVLYQWNEDHA